VRPPSPLRGSLTQSGSGDARNPRRYPPRFVSTNRPPPSRPAPHHRTPKHPDVSSGLTGSGQLLGPGGLRVQVTRRPESSHKQLGSEADLSRALVVDRYTSTREINEQLLSRLVMSAHDHIDLPVPGQVPLAELTVAIAIREALLVLVPQQHQRDMRTTQLALNFLPVRHRTDCLCVALRAFWTRLMSHRRSRCHCLGCVSEILLRAPF